MSLTLSSISLEEWALLDPAQRDLYWDVMQENYEKVTTLGLPVSKPEVMSQLERGEELWVSDLQGSEEREILRGTCPGEESSEQLGYCLCLKKTSGIPYKALETWRNSFPDISPTLQYLLWFPLPF
uniref:KRAB domain-containing protein n=1 Tax=Chrysemys picta bellii TaxID=8478 RepID=A0A8C3FRA0_CHRPI